jgi:hypothetical protein
MKMASDVSENPLRFVPPRTERVAAHQVEAFLSVVIVSLLHARRWQKPDTKKTLTGKIRSGAAPTCLFSGF